MIRHLRARMHSAHVVEAVWQLAAVVVVVADTGACTELGLGVDAAAPQIDQRLGDGEAEPGAAVRALHRAVRLLERLEQLRQHVRLHPCIRQSVSRQ